MRWQRREYHEAGNISLHALDIFDHISAGILREKVDRVGAGIYKNSSFEREMNRLCGSGVTNLTRADQLEMANLGPGNGRIKKELGDLKEITLERLLNKIKHRNPNIMNFRIERQNHIFLISPDHTQGGSEGIYEFNVMEFCDACKEVANSL